MKKSALWISVLSLLVLITGCVSNGSPISQSTEDSFVSDTSSDSMTLISRDTTSRQNDESFLEEMNEDNSYSTLEDVNLQTSEDYSLSESKSEERNQMNTNGKLFIDGKEIEYVCVINKEKREAELPLLTIAEQLGADIEWLNDTKVCISYDGHKEELDTNEEGFGWYPPPGTIGAVRKVEEHEIIMDSTSVSALIGYWFHVAINVDYQNNIVNVVR